MSAQFDIIIDDGSHTSPDINQTLLKYFPVLKPDGVYIIEDLHCSYWPAYGGGLENPSSPIELLKVLIDSINMSHWYNKEEHGELNDPLTLIFANRIRSIQFSDSMAIIRKKPVDAPSLGKRMINGQVAKVNPAVLAHREL